MSRQPSRAGRRTPVPGGFGGKAAGSRGFSGFGLASTRGSELSYLAEPPDFSAISDAQVVVSFKNLLKKDSITKAKALEDLLAYVKAHPFEQDGGPEESVIEAWIQVYPRTSIDNSRRVRELAHSLQLEFMKSARKRMERRIPKIVGPWLAGLYDRDRLVSRVANDGLSSFLNSPEKMILFWKKCQAQILEFANGAIHETKDTLSDERSTTPEDAEAKYFRVLGAALSLVLNLLEKLSDDDTSKFDASYHEFLSEDTVWKCINSGDASVHKSACQLLGICLVKRKPVLEEKLPRLRKVFLSDGLKSNHTGSAVEFVKALSSFTQSFPDIWLESSGDKKTPISRLSPFLERGSQGSPVTYWQALEALIKNIPAQALNLDAAKSIAKSLRVGISGREEPRLHATASWQSYLRVARHFLAALGSDSEQVSFASEALFPIFEHYLHPATGASTWTVPGPAAAMVVEGSYAITTESASPSVIAAATEKWEQLSGDFRTRITNSLPEVSREYQKSQQAIADEGSRWFTLIGQVQKTKSQAPGQIPETRLDSSASQLVSCCIDILSRRNLKPFGAAKTLRHMAESTMYLAGNTSIAKALFDFLLELGRENMDLVLQSQSRSDLVASLQCFAAKHGPSEQFDKLWAAWVGSLLRQPDQLAASQAMEGLLRYPKAGSLAQADDALQKYIVAQCLQSLSSAEYNEAFLEAALAYGALTTQSRKDLASGLLEHLRNDQAYTERSLAALAIVARHGDNVLSDDEELHLSLVTQLLSLAESSDAHVLEKARELRQLVDRRTEGKKPTATIIQNNLESAGSQSLEIDTLAELASQESQANAEALLGLLPDVRRWSSELSVHSAAGVNPCLSITSTLGGAQFLVRASPSDNMHFSRDRHGHSVAQRMCLYMASLLERGVDIWSVPDETLNEVFSLFLITAQMVSDQMTVMGNDKLFATMSEADQVTADQILSVSRKWVNLAISEATGWGSEADDKPGRSRTISRTLSLLMERAKDTTPLSFYSARAATEIIQSLTEEHGPPPKFEALLSEYAPSKENPSAIFPVVALLKGVGQSLDPPASLTTMCNRLVSDAAGAKPTSEKALATLVLLTCCLDFYPEGEVPVQMNRLVFAVKNITGWFEAAGPVDPFFAAESCRLLSRLLPEIASVYGSHWENTLRYCTRIWSETSEFPLEIVLSALHASIKLYSVLQSLPEPNDDLEDALKDLAETRALSLINLLGLPRDSESLPQGVVDSLLCRQVEKIPLRFVKDLSDLYGLLASESREIQTAAFSLMHRALPAIQEQLSVDVALDKQTAHLPEELLSLLLEPPTLEKYPDDMLSQFPTEIRAYLLTWHLIFDAYSAASLNVRNDYTDDLKSGNYIPPLLDFTFDVLGHSAAHPINLDKEGLSDTHIRGYDLKLAAGEPDERDMHWLFVHVYFLCLRYTPELFKAWFINCRSKQTRIAVEGWVTKFFSPLIVADALDDVSRWAAAQGTSGDDDEKELLIKVSRAAREVTAGYEVDENTASIVIKIPASYPIEGISVVGASRVVVNEKKWQSWVRTTQGVITFSNGSIIDGLMTFRRNIVGALKGQTECAICYAIISSDKKMPDKRCQTCKHLYHRTCLYKWFQSSSQNTCPLCRNPIDYLGSDTRARRAQ